MSNTGKKWFSLNLNSSTKQTSSGSCGCGKTSGGCGSSKGTGQPTNSHQISDADFDAAVDAAIGDERKKDGFDQCRMVTYNTSTNSPI